MKVDNAVISVAYSADGTKLAAGLGNPSNSVVVFDTQTNEQICSLSGESDNAIEFRWAKFSQRDKEVTGMEVVLCAPEKADANITNGEQLVGKMAAVHRGGCTFQEKTERLIAAGAAGVIIINSEDELFEAAATYPDGTLSSYSANIPVAMIKAKDAQALLVCGNSSRLRPWKDPCICNLRGHRYALFREFYYYSLFYFEMA